MTIYRYTGNSSIREIVVHHAANRVPVALLTAAPNASHNQLSAIRHALDAAGWASVPVYADGHPALQVNGFKQDAELDGLLRRGRFIEGDATVIREPEEKTTDAKLSPADRLRHMSLKLAGLFNLVGNTGMIIDGVKKGDHYRTAGGGLLTLGAMNLVRYGNARPEYYERAVAEDVAKFIRDQGGELPPDSRLQNILQYKSDGALTNAERFLYYHPAQVTLGVDAVGAGSLLASGVRKMQNKEGYGGLGFGIGSLGLKLTSMVLPEKTPDEIRKSAADTHRNALQKTIDWFREKPLRIYGYGSLVSDVFLAMDAYQQFKTNPGKKTYVYTAVASTGYTMADFMYSISSKEHVNDDGKFNKDEQRGIEAMAAESLAAQSDAVRNPLAGKLGRFLETRKEIQGNAATIAQSILEQVQHMPENPWASRVAPDESMRSR